MTGTEQPYKILFPTTEIGGSESNANPLRAGTENRTDPTIKKTIVHFKQTTVPGKIDQNQFPISNLNSGIDVPIHGYNIDNRTGINPQGPIVTTIQESNKTKNCDIFHSFIRTTDLDYGGLPWRIMIKSEGENLIVQMNFENAERGNNSKVGKLDTEMI